MVTARLSNRPADASNTAGGLVDPAVGIDPCVTIRPSWVPMTPPARAVERICGSVPETAPVRSDRLAAPGVAAR